MMRDRGLNQYFTPVWAAERIIQHYYSKLDHGDLVIDVGCGDGRFLNALPNEVQAIGIEVDSVLAAQAAEDTGREVVNCKAEDFIFPSETTLVIGNPPFEMSVVNSVIDNAYESLDYNQEVGFILPVYFFQTAKTVIDYGKKWTLLHDLMPRNMFAGMQKPLMFARFVKERKTMLLGMFLYDETNDMLALSKKYRFLFIGNSSSKHLWGEAIEKALRSLGGEGTLAEIYNELEGKQPTKTSHWKAQIRKVLYEKFQRLSDDRFSLNLSAAN